MRIALVSMHTSPAAVPGSGDAGGMNVVVAEAARALARRGHEVVTITRATESLRPGEYALEQADGDQGTATPTLIALPAGPPALRKEKLSGTVSEFAAGIRTLGTFDAVHAHYWLSAVAAREAFEHTGRQITQRIATTFHTLAALKNAHLAPGDAPEPEARVTAEHEIAAHTFVVAGSISELDAVRTYCGDPAVGSAVVHPGVDTGLFRPRPEDQSKTASRRITVLGRVQPLKGQDLAVQAFGELVRAFPAIAEGYELVIAGEPTPGAENYAAKLREIAGEYGVTDRVRFLSAQSRSQAAKLLASSTLVLVPSHSETFGLTALEAAACGVPVVVAGHTGLLEAAPDEVTGVHMRGRDPRSWAHAIAELLGDPHRMRTLSASARNHALQHDWNAHAASLELIYERLK